MSFWSWLVGEKPAPQPPPPPAPPDKVWVMGTAPWGGVVLECGPGEMALVVLPVTDAKRYAKLPAFPAGTIRAVVACNGRDDGAIAAREVALKAGVEVVHATHPGRPVERGVSPMGSVVRVEPLTTLRVGHLTLEGRGDDGVWATWSNGVTALVGPALSLDVILGAAPRHALGRIVAARAPGASRPFEEVASDVRAALLGYVPVPNVPATPADDAAGALIARAAPTEEEVIALLVAGDLARADALAEAALTRDPAARGMLLQRAVVAMLRDDDDAAIALLLLRDRDSPQAASSLANLYGRRRDPRARGFADAALAALPGDPIAVAGAVRAYALTGDPAGARRVLDQHGAPLGAEVRAAFAATVDDPPAPRRHEFPDLAARCLAAATPLVDRKEYAQAEPLLRRAVELQADDGHVVELGFVLAQLGRDADAVAVYDRALADGGSLLLRFNRGNCLLRLKRYDDAAEDYRACVKALPARPDLRINLVSALHAGGHAAAARSELDALRRLGAADRRTLDALEQMLAGAL
ncbi:MAG: tetratricopeptide repeat protein [Polyangiales bacterium]